MNISKRDTKLLLILFGIIIFILCYFLVYLGYSEQNENLEDDIQDANLEYTRLRAFEREVAGYSAEMSGFVDFILESQAEYPIDIRAEDLIMYVVGLRESVEVSTGGITFIQPIEVMTVQGIIENEQGGYFFNPRKAYRTGVNLNCSLTYQQLKDLVHFVYNDSRKTSIHSISLSYNASTGLLFGNMVINKNFLSAYDMDYVAAQIPDMEIGLPNPFGVIAAVPAAPAPPAVVQPEPDAEDANPDATPESEPEPGDDNEEIT